jgi:opacity protein-like surface antigen
MKRWFVVVLIAVLLAPMMASAQSIPAVVMEVVVPADAIGAGWDVSRDVASAGYPEPWDRQIVYGGPEGARVTVWLLGLGFGLTWVAGSWGRMRALWMETATHETGIADPETESILRCPAAIAHIPGDPTDRACVELYGDAGNLAVALYGSYNVKIGVLILAEGVVNGLTGVAAADFVAGLYFAAMSGQ